MSFLKKLFGQAKLDGVGLARSPERSDYAQIALLAHFVEIRADHSPVEQQRWSRVLPHNYAETLALFEKQGWLASTDQGRQVTAAALPFVQFYRERQTAAKAEV